MSQDTVEHMIENDNVVNENKTDTDTDNDNNENEKEKEKVESGKNKNNNRGRHRKYSSYSAYTKKLLELIRYNYRIRKDANDMFNVVIDRISICLLAQANNILMFANRTNMTDKDIQTAVIAVFPKKLANETIDYARKAVIKYVNYNKNGEGPIAKQVKANLIFPVSRFRTKISDYLIKGKQIGEPAAVFLAATLEHVVIQILEPSCEATTAFDVITVSSYHIKTGTFKNAELQMLFKRVGLYFCNNQIINKTNSFKWRPRVQDRPVRLESLATPVTAESKEPEVTGKPDVAVNPVVVDDKPEVTDEPDVAVNPVVVDDKPEVTDEPDVAVNPVVVDDKPEVADEPDVAVNPVVVDDKPEVADEPDVDDKPEVADEPDVAVNPVVVDEVSTKPKLVKKRRK